MIYKEFNKIFFEIIEDNKYIKSKNEIDIPDGEHVLDKDKTVREMIKFEQQEEKI